MNFFKILKTLNSAQSAWQVSLAIIFGMITAFLPTFTIINLIILIIVFAINIPLGLVLISATLFSLIASFLDPTFASIGYDILTNSSLYSTFASMYNQPIFLWSSYNNTIVMGSFVFSLLIALPSFFIFKFLINKYRHILEKQFKDSKYFSFLNPLCDKNRSKKPSIFRLSGLILIVSIIAIIVIILIDPVIKFALEYSLRKATQSSVHIASVKSDFSNTSLVINQITVKSDSLTKDISIKSISFKLDTNKLLHKNFDIALIKIQDVIVKTKENIQNNTSNDNTSSTKNNTIQKDDKLKLPSIDELLAKENLQSLTEAKKIKEDINNIYTKYKNFDKSKFELEKLDNLKQRTTLLKDRILTINNISQIDEILKESKSIKEELTKINSDLKNITDEYNKDKQTLQKDLNTLKTLPVKEYNHLKNKYTLDQNGALNFVQTYILPDSKKYINDAIKYYNMAKPYLQSTTKTPEEKRAIGQNIIFSKNIKSPDVVIQNIVGNFAIDKFSSDFDIHNLSSNPKAYGKLILANINGTNKFYKKASINISHNMLKDIANTKISASITKYKTKKYQAHPRLLMKDILLTSKLSTNISDYKYIKFTNNTKVLKTNMLYTSSNNKYDKTIKTIISNIHSFDINYKITGTLEHQNISVNSNLDKKIASGVKLVLNKKAEKYKKKLKVKINEKFKKELGTTVSNKEFNEVSNMIKSFSTGSFEFTNITKNSLIERIRKNEEEKVKNKAKEKAKDKLKNKLKSFF